MIINFTRDFIDNNDIKKLKRKISNQDVILNLIESNPKITTNELTKISGLSESGVYKILDKLKANNIIIHQGSKRNGYWKIIK